MKSIINKPAFAFMVLLSSNCLANDLYGNWSCEANIDGQAKNKLLGRKGKIQGYEPLWQIIIVKENSSFPDNFLATKYDLDPPLSIYGIIKDNGILYSSLLGKASVMQSAAYRILWSTKKKTCLIDGANVNYSGQFSASGNTMTGTISYSAPISYCTKTKGVKRKYKRGSYSLSESFSCTRKTID